MTGPIGLIGLGNIGMAIANRLIDASYSVIGYRRGNMDAFVACGGTPAETAQGVAERCGTIILALPNGGISKSLLSSMIETLPESRTFIDATSNTVQIARINAAEASRAGHDYLEAPVSGTPVLLRDHQATIIASGDPAIFDQNLGLLRCLAPRVHYCGAAGAASALKAAALLMIGVNTAAVAEALAYAESFGVDLTIAIEALGSGPAGSGALRHRGPLMVAKDYQAVAGGLGEFRALLSGISQSAETPTLLLDQALAYLDRATGAGLQDHDVSALFETIRRHQ